MKRRKMTFKKGDKVEVCRANGGILQSWFRAKVISATTHCFEVQYENVVNSNGKHLVEDVSAVAVRPHPPAMTETKILAVGDMVEAYDTHSWKVGKVVKTLPGKLFVVELMDSLGQKTCHQSTLRPLLAWEENKWVRIHQVDRNHLLQARLLSPKESQTGCRFEDLDVKMNVANKKGGQVEAKFYPHKRKRESQMQFVDEGSSLKTDTTPHRGRAIQSLRQPGPLVRSDKINLPVEEGESSHSSVASNGNSNILEVNSPFEYAQYSSKSSKMRAYKSLIEKDIAAQVHKCELHAYQKTIRAFFTSGCLTWEREALLTDLRLSLHISHDEHLSELTRLCPTQAVKFMES